MDRPPGAGVIQADQPAVADHIGVDDRDQLSAVRSLADDVPVAICRAHEAGLTHHRVHVLSVP
jgi:hypothetical protein